MSDHPAQSRPTSAAGRSPLPPRRCGPCSPTGGSTPPGSSGPRAFGPSTPGLAAGRHPAAPQLRPVAGGDLGCHRVERGRGAAPPGPHRHGAGRSGRRGSRSRSCPTGPDGCTVSIAEDAIDRPRAPSCRCRCGRLGILPRNREALRRLAFIAEGRHREWLAGGEDRGPARSTSHWCRAAVPAPRAHRLRLASPASRSLGDCTWNARWC